MIHILISFILEFKAVSPGRTQCFVIAAKIYGDCAIWLGGLGVGFFNTEKLSVSRGAFQNVSALLILCTRPLEQSTPVPWGMSALSDLLRDGAQVAAGAEKWVLC